MPNYALVTFGCQMNVHDSERIGDVLRAHGYREVGDPEAADLILVNTCSVREKAEQKLRSEVGRLARLKRQRKGLLLGIAGCVAQQEGEKILKAMPAVDLVIGPDNIGELPGLLAELEAGAPPLVRTVFDLETPRFLPARADGTKSAACAYVTVMKGCDERCSFCIVPYTRGPERYRPSHEIIDEIRRLVEAGTREVTLLGQTVNSYTDPLAELRAAPGADDAGFQHARFSQAPGDESEFAALLWAIAERVPGLRRLRYTSPHPRHLTRALIRAHQELGVLARHVHLPVQSGSDRVLRKMIRRYSVAEYLERTDALRSAVPDLTLSTDVIVGFPGESPEDFALTLGLVEKVGFVSLFGFKYSPRPYTPALKLGDEVSEDEKRTRLAELFQLSGALRQAHLSTLVGTTQEVLVEGPGRPGTFSGRNERSDIVHFEATGDPSGEIVKARIRRAFKNSLEGELEEPWATLYPKQQARPKLGARRSLPVAGWR